MNPPTALLIFGIKARRVGGIEMHTRKLATRLGEAGWRVVLCFHDGPSAEVRDYLSLPNVEWDQFPNAWQNSPSNAGHMLRLLRRYRPSLLHMQFTPFLSPNAWLARLCGVRHIVFTDHGSHAEGWTPHRAPAWKRLIARWINHPISLVVAVSDHNRRVLIAQDTFPAQRVRRIYNGADLTRCTPQAVAAGASFRALHGIASDRILVVQVSWIRPEKGVADVLEAFRLAAPEAPNLHAVFVGDGAWREQYERLAADYRIADRVTWAGLVNDPMSEGVFSAADIVCQASRWQEAFGLVIAESMAFGKPLVATRVGGIPEVVEDGVTGILVPAGKPAELAEKLLIMARNPELRRRFGDAGRARVSRLFDLDRNVDELMALYRGFSPPRR